MEEGWNVRLRVCGTPRNSRGMEGGKTRRALSPAPGLLARRMWRNLCGPDFRTDPWSALRGVIISFLSSLSPTSLNGPVARVQECSNL